MKLFEIRLTAYLIRQVLFSALYKYSNMIQYIFTCCINYFKILYLANCIFFVEIEFKCISLALYSYVFKWEINPLL